jgi:cysteinyl-tRNA synthetase
MAVLESFERAMDDDLNTAQALAAIFDWVRDLNTAGRRALLVRRSFRSVKCHASNQ